MLSASDGHLDVGQGAPGTASTVAGILCPISRDLYAQGAAFEAPRWAVPARVPDMVQAATQTWCMLQKTSWSPGNSLSMRRSRSHSFSLVHVHDFKTPCQLQRAARSKGVTTCTHAMQQHSLTTCMVVRLAA